MVAVFTKAMGHCGQMNERAIEAPSSICVAGIESFPHRVHPLLLAICGALISLLFAARVGAAGPLDPVTKIVGDTTKSVTQTAKTTVQTVNTTSKGATSAVSHVTDPVTDARSRAGQSVVADAAPITRNVEHTTNTLPSSAAPVTQVVTTTAQPGSQPAAPVVGAVTQSSVPVVQTAAQPTSAIVQPVTQTLPAVTTPIVRTAAPVVTSIAPTVQQLQTITTPIVAMATACSLPTTSLLNPILPAAQPIAERTQPTGVAQERQAYNPAATANRAEIPAGRASAIFLAEEKPTSARIAPPVDRAVTNPVIGDASVTMLSTARVAQPVAPRASVNVRRSATPFITANRPVAVKVSASVGALLDASPASEMPRAAIAANILRSAAPFAPAAPILPDRAPASLTSAAGAGAGHGFSFLLAIIATGWASVLTGRRLVRLLLHAQQPSNVPLDSPG
ncbi:MAG: hypothetical protein ACYDAR_17575 [Thermomicrobiales bacterium]